MKQWRRFSKKEKSVERATAKKMKNSMGHSMDEFDHRLKAEASAFFFTENAKGRPPMACHQPEGPCQRVSAPASRCEP